MNPSTLSVLLLLTGALGADPVWHVEYPKSFCVVEGSTTTIPCSYTYLGVVNRVVWCPNHLICHGNTFSVYDSDKQVDASKFVYLGDLTGNCTLQIKKTSQMKDSQTYRFRIETDADAYTGTLGVAITVTKGPDVEVRSSISEHVVREGGRVTLTCTTACSFHQLAVNWYRNGESLSETGPALHLSDLTIHNTGNYTCSLNTNSPKMSAPWSLVVEADEEGPDVEVRSSISEHVVREGGRLTLNCTASSFHQFAVNWYRNGESLSETGPALHLSNLTIHDTGNYTCSLNTKRPKISVPWSLVVEADEGKTERIIAVVIGVLLAVIFLLLAGFVIAKRIHASKKAAEVTLKQEVDSTQEVMGASEDINYSTVHFKHNSSRTPRGQEAEVIYSHVVHH